MADLLERALLSQGPHPAPATYLDRVTFDTYSADSWRGLGAPRTILYTVQVPLRASSLPPTPMGDFVENHVRDLLKLEEPDVVNTITIRQLARVEVSCCVFLHRMDKFAPRHNPSVYFYKWEANEGHAWCLTRGTTGNISIAAGGVFQPLPGSLSYYMCRVN